MGALLTLAGCTPADAFGAGASSTPHSQVSPAPSLEAFCARFSASELSQITGFAYTSSHAAQGLTGELRCSFGSATPVPNDPVVANSLAVDAQFAPDASTAEQLYNKAKQGNGGTVSAVTCTAQEQETGRLLELSGLGDEAYEAVSCRIIDGVEVRYYNTITFRKGSTFVMVIGVGYSKALEQVAHYVLNKLP